MFSDRHEQNPEPNATHILRRARARSRRKSALVFSISLLSNGQNKTRDCYLSIFGGAAKKPALEKEESKKKRIQSEEQTVGNLWWTHLSVHSHFQNVVFLGLNTDGE